MSYLGSWKIDDALVFPAITHSPATGALTDADDVPAYRVYENEVGTAILTGSMAKLDDTNTTGFYSESITLSAANGFEKGKCYTVYMTAAVGGITGGNHHTFQIEAEVDANTVSGSISSIGAGAITASSIAADAITAGKIADGAIDAATFATGAIDGNAIAASGAAAIAAGVWSEALPGTYTGSEAGAVIGDNIDGTITSRAAQTTADDIKTKTDSLTFTTPGQVDANIQFVNDVEVGGTGAGGDEWRPA